MAESADLVLVLVDPISVRFNVRELGIYHMLATKFRARLQIHCFLHEKHAGEVAIEDMITAFQVISMVSEGSISTFQLKLHLISMRAV